MNIVTRKHLAEVRSQYRDAASEIEAWIQIVKGARWTSFLDLRVIFKDADAVDGYVVFNFRRNRYRLITVIHYSRIRDGRLTEGHIYVRSFLTHREYEQRANWDRGANR